MEGIGSGEAAGVLEEAVGIAGIQYWVYSAISRLALGRSIPVLEKGLSHAGDDIRNVCAEGLGRAGAFDRGEKLFPLLERATTRATAIRVLGHLRPKGAVEKIRPYLKSIQFRVDAIRSLGLLRDKSIEPYLRARCDDLDPTVRETAGDALVRLARKEAPRPPRPGR